MNDFRRGQAKNFRVFLFIAVCLVAMNLRMTITGVGPLLNDIASDLDVSLAALGGLAAIPLVTWAFVSPFAHSLGSRFGPENSISLSLAALLVGTVWRSLPGSAANLWLGTVVIGSALAIGNVLMPAVIRERFPTRVPVIMGTYTAILGGMGAVGAGLVVPISRITLNESELGWRIALVSTGALIPISLVMWMLAQRQRHRPRVRSSRSAPKTPMLGLQIWGNRTAWLVALYMGSQSVAFFTMSTWFAPYQVSLGRSPVEAGVDLMIFTLVGIAGSLLVPIVSRGRLGSWVPALLPVIGMVAWVGLVTSQSLMPLWVVLGGLIAGAQLTVAITLMATRATSISTASALSGMAQSVGYLVAALGPIIFGWLFALTSSWEVPWSVVWVGAIVQLLAGLWVRTSRPVQDAALRGS